MLKLENIKKNYVLGESNFLALNGVSIAFRPVEFVSILGESGSGKTTLLNIIGGLDRYSKGDIIIDGVSTKKFTDKEWDAYRNKAIGFVFQNYNLISHLSLLDNVEMSLKLSDIDAKQRKQKALKALEAVGLKDHVKKKPSQLSGGQQQRVAIARALVNNPSILLADEPTGALDSVTSIQIMKLIKEISRERLVIMVTHNEQLANEYSDRVIKMSDGKITHDTNPLNESKASSANYVGSKISMSFITAIKTSFQNLLTKKMRTFITTFAGSIGIIGVALVLALSNGMTNYINEVESDSLAGFPLSIDPVVQTNAFGPGGSDSPFAASSETEFPDEQIMYAYDAAASTVIHNNILNDDFINYVESIDDSLYNSISYVSSISMTIVTENESSGYNMLSVSNSTNAFNQSSIFNEMPSSDTFVLSQYDILAGYYPTAYNEVVLVIDGNNQIDSSSLNVLGLDLQASYTFESLIGTTFHVIPNNALYEEVNDVYMPITDLEQLYTSSDAIALSVVGIFRVKEDATSDILGTGVSYLAELTDHMIDLESTSNIVLSQQASPDVNVFTGLPFNTLITYEEILKSINGESAPVGLRIYPVSFEAKDEIKAYLDIYNEGKLEQNVIIYTDTAELISSTISGLVNTITIVLAALASVSLVVSSIMIGIITYVSVVERTKEIGIMRSLGARKKDISRIFNAETLLIGFAAGLLGIALTLVLGIPVNRLLGTMIGVNSIVSLTLSHALLLITLSTFLTLLAGLIPSKIAANRDPVISLRTE